MIRRGLQYFSCFLILLGAAPLHAQVKNWPTQVVIEGVPAYNGIPVDGVYVLTGDQLAGNGYVYTRWNATPATALQLELRWETDEEIRHMIYQGATFTTIQISRTIYKGDSRPSSYGPFIGSSGTIANSSATWLGEATFEDELNAAFPDWESAGVLIPLGFGFGMMFWASALALHVPMKWVRSLADAAS